MLEGKTVVLGISGSIAAYKMANVASMLVKQHADVHVIMTKNATNFIHPITFETLTNHKTLVETFDRNFQFHVAHVSLAKKADVLLVAPASANIIAKLRYGLADDMLSTTALACTCKKIVAPAMNTNMYHNEIVQDNLAYLKQHGFSIVEPASGMLACRDIGDGKLADEETLVEAILSEIAYPKDLAGLRVLVTAGPTQEAIDPVRFITNHSSGRMGYAIARVCAARGAEVTLVSGRTALKPPMQVTTVPVVSAEDMFQAVRDAAPMQDVIIKAAAVADYRPCVVSSEKVKKKDGDLSIALERTTDILQYLGKHKPAGQFLCGFSMETENMLENSRAKLLKKHADMIVANNLKQEGAGFGTDTNIVTLITKEGAEELPKLSKEQAAARIVDEILKERAKMARE